jgi:hypothetical protein
VEIADSTVDELRTQFAARDVVALDGILPAGLIDGLTAAVDAALGTHGVRRDLRLAATGGTQRRYRIAGRDALAATSPLIGWAYRAAETLALVAAIVGEPVVPVPYAPEEFIATRLEEPGDVHDWHWDDYSYALVWVLRAPPAASGGGVELVRNVAWDKAAPRVEEHLRAHPIERFHPRAGTAYLLRANATLHRVAPLRVPAVRDMLCFSYAGRTDLHRAISHETIEALTCA